MHLDFHVFGFQSFHKWLKLVGRLKCLNKHLLNTKQEHWHLKDLLISEESGDHGCLFMTLFRRCGFIYYTRTLAGKLQPKLCFTCSFCNLQPRACRSYLRAWGFLSRWPPLFLAPMLHSFCLLTAAAVRGQVGGINRWMKPHRGICLCHRFRY